MARLLGRTPGGATLGMRALFVQLLSFSSSIWALYERSNIPLPRLFWLNRRTLSVWARRVSGNRLIVEHGSSPWADSWRSHFRDASLVRSVTVLLLLYLGTIRTIKYPPASSVLAKSKD